MSDFQTMSIQERIRAMNKTIDKIEALPSSTTPNKTVEALPQSNHEKEEQPEIPRPRRTSVVDMWRNREASNEPQQQQPPVLPMRKKSVLEKWTSAQQKSAALEKVMEASATEKAYISVRQEEKKDNNDPVPSPPKLSVAELIAQKSLQKRQNQSHISTNQPVRTSTVAHPAGLQLQSRVSVADLSAQRAPVRVISSLQESAEKQENDATILDTPPLQQVTTSTTVATLTTKETSEHSQDESFPVASSPVDSNFASKPVWAMKDLSSAGKAKTLPYTSPLMDEASKDSTKPAWANAVLKKRELNKEPLSPSTPTTKLQRTDAVPLSESVTSFLEDSNQTLKPSWGRNPVNHTPSATAKPIAGSRHPPWVKKSSSNPTTEPHSSASLNDKLTKLPFPKATSSRVERASPSPGNAAPSSEPQSPLSSPISRGLKPIAPTQPGWAKKSWPSSSVGYSSSDSNDLRSSIDSQLALKTRSWTNSDSTVKSSSHVTSSVSSKPTWTTVSLRKTSGVDHKTDSPQDKPSSLNGLTKNTFEFVPASGTVTNTSPSAHQEQSALQVGEQNDYGKSDAKEQHPSSISNDFDSSPKDDLALDNQATLRVQPDFVDPIEGTLELTEDKASEEMSEAIHQSNSSELPLESDSSIVSGKENSQPSSVGPASPPRSVRSPSATDFWNKIEKHCHADNTAQVLSVAKNEPDTAKHPEANNATHSQPILIELAMRYKSSPGRVSLISSQGTSQQRSDARGSKIERSDQPTKKSISKCLQGRDGKASVSREPAHDGSEWNPDNHASSQARLARRRSRVAQKYLSNKAVLSASSDLESVDDSKKPKEGINATIPSCDQEASHNAKPKITALIDHPKLRKGTLLTYGEGMSPKSSKLSRPVEKKEIQKRRLRLKGKDDDRSVVSSESASVFSQESSLYRDDNVVNQFKGGNDTTQGFNSQQVKSRLDPPSSQQRVRDSGSSVASSMGPNTEVTAEGKGRTISNTVHTSMFKSVISKMAMAKVTDDDSEHESFVSELSIEKELNVSEVSLGKLFESTLPLSNEVEASKSEDARYIPEALAPRNLTPVMSGRVIRKNEFSDPKASLTNVKSDAVISDVWSFLTGDPSCSNDNKSVVSTTSGASALAERATKVLQRRRGGKASGAMKVPVEPGLDNPVHLVSDPDKPELIRESDAAPFDEECYIPAKEFVTEAPSQRPPPKSTHPKPGRKSKRSAIDRSSFVNRYKSSERFIDNATTDVSSGLMPSRRDNRQRPDFSCGSELSTTSSAVAASSFDGSEPYIHQRTPSMKSDSTAGPMGIDQSFHKESSSNMSALQNAYKAVTAADLACDVRKEVTDTLTGSLEAMKSLASEFGKLAGTQTAACETSSPSPRKAFVRSTRKLDSATSDEEDVAIEVEYIGEEDESSIDDGDDLCEKPSRDLEAPAGQSSSEVYV